MTVLRQRMVEDMQLRGLSEKTQAAYVGAVRQLARHYGRSPDQLDEDALRRYLLYLKNDKRVPCGTFRVAPYGPKFLYQHTLHREWSTFERVRPERERRSALCRAHLCQPGLPGQRLFEQRGGEQQRASAGGHGQRGQRRPDGLLV